MGPERPRARIRSGPTLPRTRGRRKDAVLRLETPHATAGASQYSTGL